MVCDFSSGDERSIAPLYLSVAGFSQPSVEGNRALVETVLDMARSSQKEFWCDLFCGSGNFTLPLLSCGWSVFAVERDEDALQGLMRSARELRLDQRLETRALDLHTRKKNQGVIRQALPVSGDALGVLVNPPRSGIMDLFDELVDLKPALILYVSCYPESLARDIKRLQDSGYSLNQVSIVDQFPETHHFETVALLVRKHGDEST